MPVTKDAPPAEDPLIQHALLGEAVDTGPAAIFVLGEERRFVAVNDTACRMLGYTRGELLGADPVELVPTASRFEERMTELARTGTLVGSGDMRRKDGKAVGITYRSSETTVAGMRFWITVAFPDEPDAA